MYLHKTGSRQERSNWLGSSLSRLVRQVSKWSGWGAYREAFREQKISADVSATSITTRCLAGEKSPPLSLQGQRAQTGCVRGQPGEDERGLGPPSGSRSCRLVVQCPLWREVPQRVSQPTPDLSFSWRTWSGPAGEERRGRRAEFGLCKFVLFVFHVAQQMCATLLYRIIGLCFRQLLIWIIFSYKKVYQESFSRLFIDT